MSKRECQYPVGGGRTCGRSKEEHDTNQYLIQRALGGHDFVPPPEDESDEPRTKDFVLDLAHHRRYGDGEPHDL